MAESYYVSQHKIDESYKDGMEFGEQKGYASANRETVLRMYNQKFPIDMIARAVDMSNHEVYAIIGSNVVA